MFGFGLGLNKGNSPPTALQRLIKSSSFLITGYKATGISGGINSPFTQVWEDLTAKLNGVMWDKNSNPTLQKTYEGDALNLFPYNKITEVTDSYGNVFVRIPKFYIAKQDGAGNKGWFFSEFPIEGGYLPACFKDFTNNSELAFIDIGKHLGSLSDDQTRLESKPDRFPANGKNIVQFRELAQANGVGYQQHDIHTVDIINTLFYAMFGTINAQAIMQGYTTGQYSASHTAVVAGTGVNQIVLANAQADQYRVGQAIGIGTSLGGNQIATNRQITAINVYDASNKAIVFDGAAVNISIGNIAYNVGYKTGWSAPFQIGWKEANDGKTPCAFLGIESIFGDMWQFIDGININERQSWVCKDANSYASNLFAAPYEQLGYMNTSVDGYAKEMGFDPLLPFAEITKTAAGASATTFYSDYYYQSTGQRVARLGGYLYSGSNAGPSYWGLDSSSSHSYLNIGARLLRKPQKAESDAWALANGITLDSTVEKKYPANVLLQGFAGTASDGWVVETAPNGKQVVGLKADGIDSVGIMGANAPNPTSGDFGFGFVVKTGANKVKYWTVRGDTSDATTQYGFKMDASGNLFVILDGTSIQIGTTLTVGWHKVWLQRIGTTLKAFIDGVETYSGTHSTTLTTRANTVIFASPTSATTYTGFSNDILFEYAYDNSEIAKGKINFDKQVAQAYGL